ncbi:hypothetical protein H2514_04645 [Lysobacter sp. CW239]|nr:hypothetical protein [Lysobacter concretionis]QOD91925.1 hypothetical protein H2514_04645 [Lysobacter sp. CW239]
MQDARHLKQRRSVFENRARTAVIRSGEHRCGAVAWLRKDIRGLLALGIFGLLKGIEMGGMMTGGLGLVIALFVLVLAVLWFLLPFAIFGTKDKLAEIIAESKKTNAELARIAAELAANRTAMATRLPGSGISSDRAGEV